MLADSQRDISMEPSLHQSLVVLVVDDDPAIRELLADYLGEQNCTVHVAENCEIARELVVTQPITVVLLDISLPGEDGYSFARHLRAHHDVGIIFVSGAGDTIDRIVGLEIGADDYLSKPFELRELRARLRSVARRYTRAPALSITAPTAATAATRRVRMGDCALDLDRQQLFGADGAEIAITAMEFELLRVFAERPNRPLSRDTILDLTQNREWDPFDRSIDIRIARLRRKLESDPGKPGVIRTVRNVGYMFVTEK